MLYSNALSPEINELFTTIEHQTIQYANAFEKLNSKINEFENNIQTLEQYKEFFSKEVFSEAKYVKFRDGMFPIPVGYEEYLSKMYGDYMKLPKEEDRVFHDFEGYIK